jgi:uncharacterized membrane protein YkvA (DUF1232 family)
MRKVFMIGRLLQLRHELVRLWHAFFDPRTPLYLKAAMIGVALYLVSPIDLIPDFIFGLGIVDDLVLVSLALSWIAARLPGDAGARTIDGSFRRR